MHATWMTTVAVLALAAGPALGQVDENDNKKGFYIGAGLGEFSSSIDGPPAIGEIDLDSDDTATKLFGGWRLNPYFAVQFDYIDFGRSSTSNPLAVSSDTSGFAPNVIGTLPIGFFELFAKIGLMWYDVDLDVENDPNFSDSSEDPIYGVGVGVTLIERLSLRLEYEVVDIERTNDADAVWLTASWRF